MLPCPPFPAYAYSFNHTYRVYACQAAHLGSAARLAHPYQARSVCCVQGVEYGEFEMFDDDQPVRGGPSRGQQRLNLRNALNQRDSPFDQGAS